MLKDELLVLWKTLSDYLSKGFIKVSNSPTTTPILFAKKPGNRLCFYIDYCILNSADLVHARYKCCLANNWYWLSGDSLPICIY